MNCKVKLTVCKGAALLPKVTATQDEDAVTITVKDMNGEASATVPIMKVDSTYDPASENAQSGSALSAAIAAKRITAPRTNPGCFYEMPSGAYLLDGWFKIAQMRDDYGVEATQYFGEMALIYSEVGMGSDAVLFDAAKGELVCRHGSPLYENRSYRTKIDNSSELIFDKVEDVKAMDVFAYPSAKAVYDYTKSVKLNKKKALKSVTLSAGQILYDYSLIDGMALYIMYEEDYLPENVRIKDVAFDLSEECQEESVKGIYYGTEVAAVARTDAAGEKAYVLINEAKIEVVPKCGQKILLFVTDPEQTDESLIFPVIDGYGSVTFYYEEN